ncbi:cutinase family protein [Mycobacterium sp. CVI_P3]|uniref:Cutinase family protein n=1 Tax=Mycobacterium pinniadriaticum TaxID=2994102 RepID=A0ABT3SDJ3_9MYCO|nr:cutinase family protein [Mycobacterium pinniadriaticum]MCX2931182.1 cutinase family protein [Mycobacterium pinniadriaticum]MCX2937594.1 cutinase family protein [Mycobacterium pinniadriaticum]
MKTTLIWAPGTWEAEVAESRGEHPAEDNGFGLGLWLVDWRFEGRLDPARWSYRFLCPPGYKGSFGFIDGDGQNPEASLLNPSYEESVSAGVDYAIGVIKRTPGPLVLGGYSQGADLASRLVEEFTSGRLVDRRGDLDAVVTFGNPRRAQGREIEGQPALEFAGIGGGIEVRGVLWYDYCFPADMYGNANPNSFLHAGYELFTPAQLHNPWDYAKLLQDYITDGRLYSELGIKPDDWIWKITHPIEAFKLAGKVANTIVALGAFATTGAHGHYSDQPLWDGGEVPVFHAIHALNQLAVARVL